MGSLNFKELKIDDLMNNRIHNKFNVITLKRDGTEMYWKEGNLISARGIIRSNRFPELTAILRKNNFPDCIGEVYIENGNVFDVTSSKNWYKAKFMPFTLLNCNNPLWVQLQLILENVKAVNSEKITPLKFFDTIEQGWDYVEQNNSEGLVCRNTNDSYYKIKKMIEGKFKIVSHEKGSDKGTFILENGSRISGTSLSFVHKFEELSKSSDVIAEVEYPFITDSGKLFQPRLRQITAVGVEG